MADQRVGIDIVARDQASAVIGRTRVEMDKLSAEINRLKREAAGGADVSKKIGEAMIRQSEAAKRLRDETAKVAQAQGSLKGALAGAQDALTQHAGAAGRAASSLGLVGGAAGAAVIGLSALVATMVAAARATADYQEQLDLVADATGLTASQVAGLKLAASEVGRSFDQVRPSLDFFVRTIGSAAEGDEKAVAAFQRLGVAVRGANGEIRPTGDILKDVQARLSTYSSESARATAAAEVFGARAAKSLSILMTPLDEVTARAEKLGLALGPGAAEQARRADVAFDALNTTVQALSNSFGVLSIAVVNPFLENIAKAGIALAEYVNDPNWEKYKSLSEAIRDAQKRFANPIGAALADRQAAERAAKQGPAGASAGFVGSLPGGAAGGSFSAAPDVFKSQAELKKALDERAEAEKEAAKAALKFAADSAAYMQGQTVGLVGTAFAAPPLSGISPVRDERGLTATDKYLGGTASIMQTPDDLRAGNLEDVAEALKNANGDMMKFAEELEKVRAGAEEGVKGMSDFEKAMANDVANSFGNFVASVIRGTDDIAEAFGNMMRDIIADIAAAALKKGILTLIGLQQGGTVNMQAGGTVHASFAKPLMAQSGLVVSGIRGADTVPAMLGRGETVISHALTDRLDSFLSRMDRMLRMPVPQPAMATAGGGQVTVNLSYQGGGLEKDRLALSQWVRDDLTPVLRRELAKGGRS